MWVTLKCIMWSSADAEECSSSWFRFQGCCCHTYTLREHGKFYYLCNWGPWKRQVVWNGRWPQFLWWLESRARRMTPMQTWLAWFESLANTKGWEHPGSLISSMWAQEEVEGYGLKAPSCEAYKHGVGLTISRHESSLAVAGWDPLWWVRTVRYDAAFLCLFAVPASLSPFLLHDQDHHLNHDGSWIFSFLSTSQAAGKGNE